MFTRIAGPSVIPSRASAQRFTDRIDAEHFHLTQQRTALPVATAAAR
jgi:hypothetical protein